MKKFKIGASDKVVRFFLNRGKKSEIDEILALTFRQKLPEIQQISIKGMGEWGSKKSILHLEEAIESNDSETSSLAKKTYQQISKRLSANRPYLVKPLATLFEEYEHWYIKAEEHAAIPLEKQKYIGKREGIARSIEQIISSQMHIRNHYPDLYCMECKTKAEELIHRKWRYVRCKTCREALDLHTEIENVTGIIGPMPEPMEGVYYLELWNENLSASQVGELDQIEIRPGADFNYNWAVSAVVEGLQNRWPDVDLALPVKLDPTIQLQANTLTLLKSIRQGG